MTSETEQRTDFWKRLFWMAVALMATNFLTAWGFRRTDADIERIAKRAAHDAFPDHSRKFGKYATEGQLRLKSLETTDKETRKLVRDQGERLARIETKIDLLLEKRDNDGG